MAQLLLNFHQERKASWGNFIVSTNIQAFETLRTWLNQQDLVSQDICCFYLSGATGCGKTHLLKSSGLLYIDAQQASSNASEFTSLINSSDYLAIDHLSLLSATQQIELFNCFNRIKNNSGKILLGERQPPLYLDLREDLRTRLGSGLIFQLQQLDEAGMLQLLEQICQHYQLNLPNSVINFILARCARDSHSLIDLFTKIDHLSLVKQRVITIPFLREMLADELRSAAKIS